MTSDAHTLYQLQRRMADAIMRPLTAGQRIHRRSADGRPMQDLAAELIKPSKRLTSLERLEIYNRQYWFRVVDSLYEDFPGMRAILGQKRFDALITAYLLRYPSRSFTLNDLGGNLERFLNEEPHWASPLELMAADMARFEWAQVVAFDGEERPPITAEHLPKSDATGLTLQLQPYLSVLELGFPLDDFVIGLKRLAAEHTEAGITARHRRRRRPRIRLPEPQPTFLVVHRFRNSVYYKRLEPEAFRLLAALSGGQTVGEALTAAFGPLPEREGPRDKRAACVADWFATWAQLNWFCGCGIK